MVESNTNGNQKGQLNQQDKNSIQYIAQRQAQNRSQPDQIQADLVSNQQHNQTKSQDNVATQYYLK
jgi:hypothetical protein